MVVKLMGLRIVSKKKLGEVLFSMIAFGMIVGSFGILFLEIITNTSGIDKSCDGFCKGRGFDLGEYPFISNCMSKKSYCNCCNDVGLPVYEVKEIYSYDRYSGKTWVLEYG